MTIDAFYIGYGCLSGHIEDGRLVIPCWETYTTNLISRCNVSQMTGSVAISEKKEVPSGQDGCTQYEWQAVLSPNSTVSINVQCQYEIVLSWDGENWQIVEEKQA